MGKHFKYVEPILISLGAAFVAAPAAQPPGRIIAVSIQPRAT
jgi:hypothetical protein